MHFILVKAAKKLRQRKPDFMQSDYIAAKYTVNLILKQEAPLKLFKKKTGLIQAEK